MIFECGDLERALANPELMAEAQRHIRTCETCRNEYRVWNEISNTAKQLHSEWESPDLWLKIRRDLQAQVRPAKGWWLDRKIWAGAIVAAALVLFAFLRWPVSAPNTPASTGKDFLTEQAFKEVEKNEAAYRRSIEDLSRLAKPELEGKAAPPILASYREKLLMLDAAIQETRSNVAQNPFNASLQTELADLYREKRQTLEEVLKSGQRN